MTNEEKQLVLKDLCGRLPYGVAVRVVGDWFEDEREPYDRIVKDDFSIISDFLRRGTLELRPYLRPMSSMTEEEKDYYDSITYTEDETHFKGVWCNTVVDWLNAHHFDYLDLIEKGLALEAPEGMYEIVPTRV